MIGFAYMLLAISRSPRADVARIVSIGGPVTEMALGHNGKAVHRAYARQAQMTVPALEDYEKEFAASKITVHDLYHSGRKFDSHIGAPDTIM